MENALFGVEELVAKAEARVGAAGIRAESGQVAEALTVRNARYYATLGLLAPAAARRGRNALYTDAHVDQLVAVKRLQGEGLHLAEIQRALVGLAPDRVRAIAEGEAAPTVEGAGTAPPSAPLPSAATASPWAPRALVIDLGEGVALQIPPALVLAPAAVDRVLHQARAVLSGTTAHDAGSLIFPNAASPQGQEHRR